MQEITLALSENYVISEILIDLKGMTIPFGFSSYFLQSMYQAYLNKETLD